VTQETPVPDDSLQRKYRVRILLFLLAVPVCLLALSALYQAVNTINRLEIVESERDQWQRPAEIAEALNLKQGSVVVDLGSGAGYFALKLSRAVGRTGKVMAVDVRRLPLIFLWIRTVLRNQHNIEVIHGDTDDPHLPTARLDAALIANTYHEFTNPELMLHHMFRSLRPGGRLVVVDRSRAAIEREEGDHHHELAPALAEQQLRQKGFEIISRQDQFIDRPSGDLWWMIIVQKPFNKG
jgi:ubiquinone/menaquinone biosynthesis C-methylase UbiE